MQVKNLLFLSMLLFLFSCSNSLNVTQTPDDVYYSPVTGMGENKKKQETARNNSFSNEDREIRMSRYNRRWQFFGYDYGYHYSPYLYGFNQGYYFNPYYNPYPIYYSGISLVPPKNNAIRTTNLSSYNIVKQNFVNNPKYSGSGGQTRQYRYNNSNNDGYRQNGSSSGGSGNSRTYSPSTNSSSSGSSGSSISRPGRN
jgi:hypothetical protein